VNENIFVSKTVFARRQGGKLECPKRLVCIEDSFIHTCIVVSRTTRYDTLLLKLAEWLAAELEAQPAA
jgi:hypothetical protein